MIKENIFKNKILVWSTLCSLLLLFTISIIKNNPQILSSGPELNMASTAKYIPLTGDDEILPSENASFSDLVKQLFNWGIAIAIILAIMYIVIGGIQYMTTDAVFDKGEGREKISSAIGGLILALATFLILQTINPQIVGLNFTVTPGSGTAGGGGGGVSVGNGGAASPNTTNDGSGVTIGSSIINSNSSASGVVSGVIDLNQISGPSNFDYGTNPFSNLDYVTGYPTINYGQNTNNQGNGWLGPINTTGSNPGYQLPPGLVVPNSNPFNNN